MKKHKLSKGNGKRSQSLESSRGNITIFLVIVIPFMIFGIFVIYDLIEVKQMESQALKVTVACSEARLSRYNAFLFERYGLLAYLEDGSLENMIKKYYEKNKLGSNLEIEISHQSLDDPIEYLSAVKSAAPYVISEVVIDETMKLLEQNQSVLKAQKLVNDKIDRYQELAKSFERSKTHEALEKAIDFRDSHELREKLIIFRSYIDEGNLDFKLACVKNEIIDKEIEMSIDQRIDPDAIGHIETDIDTVKSIYKEVWSETQVKALKSAYDVQTNQLYYGYIKLMEDQSQLSAIEQALDQIEVQIQGLNQMITELSRVEPMPIEAIENLMVQINDYRQIQFSLHERETDIRASTKQSTEALLKHLTQDQNSLMNALNTLKAKLDKMVGSKIGLESKILPIGPAYLYSEHNKASDNRAFNEAINQISLPEKIMINEYLITICKSLVDHDVRYFDPLKVRETPHANINGEVEYLLGHSNSDVENFNEVRSELLIMRTGLNLIGIILDPEKRSEITSLSAPLPFPWNAVAYSSILVIWSGAEGFYDVSVIESGKGQHFIKKDGEWCFSLESLLQSEGTLSEAIASAEEQHKNISEPNKQTVNLLDTKLYYRDYLRILINAQGLDRTILRHMELVASQIQTDSQGEHSLANFQIGHKIGLKSHFSYFFKSDTSAYWLNFSNAYDLHFER